MSTDRTLFEKVWRRHVVADLGEGFNLLHVDRHVVADLNGNAFMCETPSSPSPRPITRSPPIRAAPTACRTATPT